MSLVRLRPIQSRSLIMKEAALRRNLFAENSSVDSTLFLVDR